MKTSRRHLLGLSAAGIAVSLLSGCETFEQRLTKVSLPPFALPPPELSAHSPSVRLLNRVAYGPRAGDADRIAKIGISAYVAEQLTPEALEEETVLIVRLRSLNDLLEPDTGILFDEDDRQVVAALRQAALLRAVYSRRQLQERMVEFWTDHFNIYAFKGQGPQLKVIDDQETIRRYALSSFRELLGASARSAAMLGYLDNTANRKGIPNENYARELMELHTLGVHGGYSQSDVKEVARCFTGWTSEKHWHRGRFLFDSDAHDDGPKQVLHTAIPSGGGVRDGELVLDLLASHPATAQHIAQKLCCHFLGQDSEEWKSRLAEVYMRTGGNIKAMLQPLLTSQAMVHSSPIFKRPLDFAVSALRALNVDTDGGSGVQEHLEKMGQSLYAWPMPDGYPEGARFWTAAMIPRWNFALAVAGQTLENTSLNWDSLWKIGKDAGLSPHDTLLEMAFGCRATDPILVDVRAEAGTYHDPAEFAAVLLMSPAFQWR